MNNIVIASFYKFVSLPDFEQLRERLLAGMQAMGIKGTIILAHEGINGSFAGLREQMDSYYDFIRQDARLQDIRFKENFDSKVPFAKSKVKLRKEIVTMGIPDLDPEHEAGVRLSPEEWNQLIQDPNVVLIDTRNQYEYEIGTFENAINPATENFRNFPEYVSSHLADKKDKKIAMFCTGGIRCEKSTAYLKSLGFDEVYHLQDGIINYMEKMPREQSLWQGQCFVFDDRVAIDHDLNRVYPQLPDNKKSLKQSKENNHD